ncbi:MAG: hypothetical protein RIC14_15715 [Filomicrobium sp.]
MHTFRFWLVAVLAVLLGLAVWRVFVDTQVPAPQIDAKRDKSEITRLVLVETDGFSDPQAQIRTLVRESPGGAWKADGAPASAMIGRAGLGWAYTQREFAKGEEPIKREGDKRAPAGLFRFGSSFGSGPSQLTGYMQLEAGQQFCVDDTASDKYGQIVRQDEVPAGTSGEKMWEIGIYRLGLVVDYPTDRVAKAGSCIFIHVWKSPETPTVGCVAADEGTVARLQEWVNDDRGGAAIAIVPREARGRLGLNLPE